MLRVVSWAIFFLVLTGLAVTIMELPPWSGVSLETRQDAGEEQVIQLFRDPETLALAWELTSDLLEKEDERFRHIDTKSSAFLGMIGLALTIIASIVGVLLDRDFIVGSPRDFRVLLGLFWLLAFIFLLASFLVSLESIQVVTDPSKGGHRDLPTDAIIGIEQVKQDKSSYQKAVIAESWQVISRNRYENNRKALLLLTSQKIATYAVISLLGFGLLLGAALCMKRP